MAHVRQQIRDHVLTLLNGNVVGISAWYVQRRQPLAKAADTIGLIHIAGETSEPVTQQPVRLERQLDLVIEGRFKAAAATIDNLADDFAARVEPLICADTDFAGLVKNVWLRATNITFDEKGEIALLALSLHFLVTYSTRDITPETPI